MAKLSPCAKPSSTTAPDDITPTQVGGDNTTLPIYANGEENLQFQVVNNGTYWDPTYPVFQPGFGSRLGFFDAHGHYVVINSGIFNADGIQINTQPTSIYISSGHSSLQSQGLPSIPYYYVTLKNRTGNVTLYPLYRKTKGIKSYMDDSLVLVTQQAKNYDATSVNVLLDQPRVSLLLTGVRGSTRHDYVQQLMSVITLKPKAGQAGAGLKIKGKVYALANINTPPSPIAISSNVFCLQTDNSRPFHWATYAIGNVPLRTVAGLTNRILLAISSYPTPAGTFYPGHVYSNWFSYDGKKYGSIYDLHISSLYGKGNTSVYEYTQANCQAAKMQPFLVYFSFHDQYGNFYQVEKQVQPTALPEYLFADFKNLV